MKNKNLKKISLSVLTLFLFLMTSLVSFSQGVTNSSLSGKISDQSGEVLPGAYVVAVHMPSGTRYSTISNNEGRYFIPSMRVGGPYTIEVTFLGYSAKQVDNINLSLGVAGNVSVSLEESESSLQEVLVTSNSVFSSDRTA